MESSENYLRIELEKLNELTPSWRHYYKTTSDGAFRLWEKNEFGHSEEIGHGTYQQLIDVIHNTLSHQAQKKPSQGRLLEFTNIFLNAAFCLGFKIEMTDMCKRGQIEKAMNIMKDYFEDEGGD